MKTILTLCFLFLTNLINSQTHYGITTGLQTSGITNAKMGDNQNGYGAYLGVFVQKDISETFTLNSQLKYSYQNIRNLITNSNIIPNSELNFNNYYKLHYVKMPITLRYNWKKFYSEIGPELSFLVYNSVLQENIAANSELKYKLTNTNAFQFGLVIGAGYTINSNLQTGFTFGWNFNKIADNLPYDIKVFNVGIGVQYLIK